MKKSTIIISIVIALIVILIGSTWSGRNRAYKLENKVKAQYASNQSEYDNMWKKFKELTQVTSLQAEQFKSVYTDLIAGRNQDANLLFKSIREDNPKLDASVYKQLQTEISAGRNTFQNSQKKIIDLVREYNDYVGTSPLMMLIGRNELDQNDYFITSFETKDAFNSKEAEEIKLK